MILANILNSPLFNLSLTNKELFHSNFIAWFGKFYPGLFVKLICHLLQENKWADGLDIQKMEIRREYKNFDISVFDDVDSKVPRLVIENKVKSVPTQEQLIRYQRAINNDGSVELLLLTMNEQLHYAAERVNTIRWKLVNYTQLSDCLKELIQEVNDSYHRSLLNDYCEYVSRLESLINGYTNNLRYLYSAAEFKEQLKLGIHDVCGKRKVQDVYSLLVHQLQDQRINVVEKISELKHCVNVVLVSWAYTNAPLIEVRLKSRHKEDEYILIQVQGKQYRHCVEFFDQCVGKRISMDKNGSFGPNEMGIQFLRENYPDVLFGERALKNYPMFEEKSRDFRQRKKDGGEGYCKYCNGRPSAYNGKVSCFVYQWVELPEKISTRDLVEAVVADTSKLLRLCCMAK